MAALSTFPAPFHQQDPFEVPHVAQDLLYKCLAQTQQLNNDRSLVESRFCVFSHNSSTEIELLNSKEKNNIGKLISALDFLSTGNALSNLYTFIRALTILSENLKDEATRVVVLFAALKKFDELKLSKANHENNLNQWLESSKILVIEIHDITQRFYHHLITPYNPMIFRKLQTAMHNVYHYTRSLRTNLWLLSLYLATPSPI